MNNNNNNSSGSNGSNNSGSNFTFNTSPNSYAPINNNIQMMQQHPHQLQHPPQQINVGYQQNKNMGNMGINPVPNNMTRNASFDISQTRFQPPISQKLQFPAQITSMSQMQPPPPMPIQNQQQGQPPKPAFQPWQQVHMPFLPQQQQQQQQAVQQSQQQPPKVRSSMMDIQVDSPYYMKFPSNDNFYSLDSDCAIHLTKKVLDDLNILLRFVHSSDSPLLQSCSSHLLTAKHNITKFTTSIDNNSQDKWVYLSAELTNAKLEDFTFLDILGRGTFGIARLCRYVPLNEYLCVKVLNKETVVKLKQVEHVLSEKYILSNCRHPFIVQLYKTFQDETSLYFIMEYVSGGELFTVIKRQGGLQIEAARIYAAEILLVVEYLHLNHIIHRDLKPENLLIDKAGHLKLTDFGFAKYLVDRTWTTCGTPEYMAPEIILGKGHNKGVDYWSLGILLFEMIAGRPPFEGDEETSVFEKILALDYIIPANFDPAAADLISKLLVLDTTHRLGCMIGGVNEVKNHPFFEGVNWNSLLLKTDVGPIHPRIMKENDTSNFFVDSEEVTRNLANSCAFNDDIFRDF